MSHPKTSSKSQKKLSNPADSLEQFIRSSEFYRLLADSITDVIWVLDVEQLRVAYVAPAAERLLGYTPEEMVGRPLLSFMPEVSLNFVESVIAEERNNLLVHAATPRTLELILNHKNGSTVWTEVPSRFIRDSKDHVIGIIGVARDCTERVNAVEALRVSEERYRTILENIEEGYCEADLSGNFVFANSSACRLIGYPEAELIGTNFREVLDPENALRVFHAFSRVFQSGEPYRGLDFEVIWKNGERRQVEISVTLIKDQNNKPVGFRGIGRDITARKQEELKLKKAYDDLDQRVMERTAELARINKILESKTESLEDANIALRVLLEKKDESKKEIEEHMVFNVMEAVTPMLERIKAAGLSERQQAYFDMVELQLEKITSPFSQSLSMQFRKLTPAEIQVANLIKHGKTTKEIAELANLAASTIDFHRKNIRKKFHIDNQKVNLRTYLLSLEK
jgi:PAS domain S-box-containing protein